MGKVESISLQPESYCGCWNIEKSPVPGGQNRALLDFDVRGLVLERQTVNLRRNGYAIALPSRFHLSDNRISQTLNRSLLSRDQSLSRFWNEIDTLREQ